MPPDVSGPTDIPEFYERPGLNTETYDLRTASDTQAALGGDVHFYRTLAERTGGPVLDLGGGTGRVTWQLAEAGFEVVSLDLSEGMQAQARAKEAAHPEAASRVRFVHGDMSEFEVPERFGLVVIPFRSFQALLSPELQRSCLQSIRRHLRPGGTLAFHVFDPLLQYIAPEATASTNPDRGRVRHPVSGNEVHVSVLERQNDPVLQVMQETWQFVELDAEGRAVRTEHERLSMRWTYRQEMRYLLDLSGFTVEAEYADFCGSPPTYGKEQVYVATPLV